MDVACPVCASRSVDERRISERVIVFACPECGTVFTVQLGAVPRRPPPNRTPSDSSPGAGR